MLVSSTWSLLDIVLRTISEELHDELAQWEAGRPGLGRPAWDFTCFGSILYVVFQKSLVYQNSWNSLMLVKFDAL